MKRVAALASLVLAAGLFVRAQDLREEFHKTYPLSATGRVSVHNVNGPVHVTAWDRNEVKVDAVKRARSQRELEEAEIVVDARPDSVEIRTKHPERDGHDGASVDYTVSVPRAATLDPVSAVNGNVEIDGVAGPVTARTVNGKIDAHKLESDVDLATTNGRIEAAIERMPGKSVSVRTVNGGIALALPKGAGARLNAKTVHGGIQSDFDLPVRRVGFGPGSDVEAVLGGGGPDVHLRTVNGGINLRRQ